MARSPIRHDYHLADPSPWPVIGAAAVLVTVFGAVFWLNTSLGAVFGLPPAGAPFVFAVGLVLLSYTAGGWLSEIIRESGTEGRYKPAVKHSLHFGMGLFIAAQAMFFVPWFWAYFHSARLAAATGGTWPPGDIVAPDPWRLPLIATLILLTSATAVTWARHAVLIGERRSAANGLLVTILLGASFVGVQAYQFAEAGFGFGMYGAERAPFTDAVRRYLSAGAGDPTAIYGTTFFMAAGLHAVQAAIGTVFFTVCLFRTLRGHFTAERHSGFLAAQWNWQFVIFVWLVLYASIYIWGAPAPA